MFTKGRWGVLSLVVALTLIISACGGTPTPTPVPPTATKPPAAAPTTAPAAAPTATQPPAAPTATTAAKPAGNVTIYGEQLPADAAPYDMQTYKVPCDIKANHTTFDFQVAVYQRPCVSDLFGQQLVNLDKDFNVIPNAAESWSVSSNGLVWTFKIRPGQVWSDGTPVTANDWVATYQYAADPKHAWDFAWFYAGVLKNWDDIIAGKKPTSELGVKAVDDLTLQFETQSPWPAFPSMMQFSFVLQKKALETVGPYYNSKVETSVSMGPFKLAVYQPMKHIEMVPNPTYKGFAGKKKPFLSKIIVEYMDISTSFAAFQNYEIDTLSYEYISPADLETVLKTPQLKNNLLVDFGDFRTDYLVMDTYNPPFNDLNVRKAFAHAVDRESIVKNVLTPIKGMPAYSFLMPGFPDSDKTGALKQYQMYDCNMAKDYLAKAGYPGGKGFPKLEMWLRNEVPAWQAVFQAVAASIASCLNVQIDVSNKDYKVYMDALNSHKLQFGAVSYGMDYLDPSNMLGIWLSTGRHAWKNEQFDKLVKEASSLTGDPAKRSQMFKDAEKILVDDVGGIFIDHRWFSTLFQPFVLGDFMRKPDKLGYAAWHWGNDYGWTEVYIGKDVANFKTYRTK
jgi:peptide/nickel transport system substrate-binding protein/oligopeptide transport system substrate-binding protein